MKMGKWKFDVIIVLLNLIERVHKSNYIMAITASNGNSWQQVLNENPHALLRHVNSFIICLSFPYHGYLLLILNNKFFMVLCPVMSLFFLPFRLE